MIRFGVILATLALLAACASPAPVTRIAMAPGTLPATKSFGPARPQALRRSSASFQRDFLRLAFTLESGRALPVFTRFEGPVSLRLTGRPASRLTQRDLDNLIARLRNEAKINISRASSAAPANITIELMDRAALQRAVPNAACFVAPNASSWSDFLRNRNNPRMEWTQLTTRRQMAIFIPADVSAQEIRDCMHEEVAQALGPVNDLYDLTDSIFNDDNFHTVLTGFDMAILRAYYHPSLSSGMSRAQVAAALPGIASQLGASPGGAAPPVSPTPISWKRAVQTALGASTRNNLRLGAAQTAAAIARNQGWRDTRLGFSLYALGRLSLPQDPDTALAAFAAADNAFSQLPGAEIHRAHIGVQTAAFALSSGQAERAIAIVDRHSPAILRAQNAWLLATMLMIKAEALQSLGRDKEATTVRLDSLGWARYAFGSETEIRARLTDIQLLARRTTGEQAQ